MSDVNKQLLDALKDLFASYKQLADSGDAGNWRIEDFPEGKQAIEAIAAAEPVAWEVRNGVATHDFYRSEAEAEEVARDMQKSHDLSGSLAAFNVRPVYSNPPAVAVPDAKQFAGFHPTEYSRGFENGWNACRDAMLASAQKGGGA